MYKHMVVRHSVFLQFTISRFYHSAMDFSVQFCSLQGGLGDFFVCVEALHPCQQFISHVGIIFCLPGLNKY